MDAWMIGSGWDVMPGHNHNCSGKGPGAEQEQDVGLLIPSVFENFCAYFECMRDARSRALRSCFFAD